MTEPQGRHQGILQASSGAEVRVGFRSFGDVAFRLRPTRQGQHPLAKAAERLWEIGDIVNVLEAWEAAK
jgi:hypothetical protein